MRHTRRAAINKVLVIVLAIAAAGAGVFWFVRSGDENVGPGGSEVTLYCVKCGPQKVATAKVKEIPFDAQSRLKCPKCGEFTASFYESGPVSEAAPSKP